MPVRGDEALRWQREGHKDATSRNTQDITHLQPRRNTPPAESILTAATSLGSEETRASSPTTGRQHQGDNRHAITLGTTRHSCMATLAATAAGVIGLCGTRPLARSELIVTFQSAVLYKSPDLFQSVELKERDKNSKISLQCFILRGNYSTPEYHK